MYLERIKLPFKACSEVLAASMYLLKRASSCSVLEYVSGRILNFIVRLTTGIISTGKLHVLRIYTLRERGKDNASIPPPR